MAQATNVKYFGLNSLTHLWDKIKLADSSVDSSLASYAHAQDVAYDSSMKTYVDTQNEAYDSSMKSYVEDQDSSLWEKIPVKGVKVDGSLLTPDEDQYVNIDTAGTYVKRADFDTSLAAVDGSIGDLKEADSSISDAIDALTEKDSSIYDAIDGLTEEDSSLTGAIADLTAEDSSLTSAIADLTANDSSITSAIADLTAADSSIVGAIANLTAEDSSLTGAIADLTAEDSSITSAIADLTANDSSILAAIHGLTAEDASLESGITRLDGRINDLGAALKYKGTKATYEELPASGNETGDVWNVTAAHGDFPAGTNWAWDGSAWDALGGAIDTSAWLTNENLIEITNGEIDTICV